MRRPGAPPLPPRTRILQEKLNRSDGRRYLEIGLGGGAVFLQISARYKVGVDPGGLAMAKRVRHPLSLVRSKVARATSDEFFAVLGRDQRFDVTFVDGYHTWEQALRDVDNSLRHTVENGVVAMHDCNPPDEAAGMRDPHDAAVRQGEGPWCGDVWKAVVYMRACRPDLQVEVLDTDFGVGIVRRGRSRGIPISPGSIARMTYPELESNRELLLGLRPWDPV